MKSVRCLSLALISIGVFLTMPVAHASDEIAAPAAAGNSVPSDEATGPSFEMHGEAKKIIRRSRVEVLELRGARRNPNFLEESFQKSEVRDVARWNHQHDNITPVKGLKRSNSRMPASLSAHQSATHLSARKSSRKPASQAVVKRPSSNSTNSSVNSSNSSKTIKGTKAQKVAFQKDQ